MTHPALRPLFTALSILLLPAAAAAASTGLYLDIASIPGESVDPGHAGQIDVGGLSWGVSVGIGPRGGGSPSTSKPSVQDLAWSQGIDKSTLPLFNNVTSGQRLPSAGFQVVQPGGSNAAPFLSLTAQQALLSSVQFSGGSGVNTINASLSPSVVTLSYDPSAVVGGSGSALTTRYDVASNVATGPAVRQPVAGSGTAPATAGLYLRLGSGTTAIAGDSRAIGYENWISIGSFSMGTTIAQGPGGTMGSKPSVSDLTWSQTLDATAPTVLFDLLKGQLIGQVTIEQVVLDRNGRPVTVMQEALNDVLFSAFSLSTAGSGVVSFSGSMNFASFSQTLWPTLADGSRGTPTSYGFDIVNGKSIPGTLASNVAGFGNGNLDPSTPAVPEPQTWALLLGGIAGLQLRSRLAAAARRRKLQSA